MYVDSSWLSGSLAIAGRNCVSVKLSSIFVAVFFFFSRSPSAVQFLVVPGRRNGFLDCIKLWKLARLQTGCLKTSGGVGNPFKKEGKLSLFEAFFVCL